MRRQDAIQFSINPMLKARRQIDVIKVLEVRLSASAGFYDLRRDHNHARPAEGTGGRPDGKIARCGLRQGGEGCCLIFL